MRLSRSRRCAIVGLATLTLAGCTRSEAEEAADASDRDRTGVRENDSADHHRAGAPSSGSYEDALADEEFMADMFRELGSSSPGEARDCDQPTRRSPVPAGWVSDEVRGGAIPLTLHRPPGWTQTGGEGEGSPRLLVSEAEATFVLTPPFPRQPGNGERFRELSFAASAMVFQEIFFMERLDAETCLIFGLLEGMQAGTVTHLRTDGVGALVMGMVVPGASQNQIDDLQEVLRQVDFG